MRMRITFFCLSILVVLPLACIGCTGRAGTVPDKDQPAVQAASGIDPQVLGALREELSRQLAKRGITLDKQGRVVGKAPSAVPKRIYQIPGWINVGGDSLLGWGHYQQGDYDQNGEVNISDLTPIGIHFMKNTSSSDWSTAAVVADGDLNGEVNLADVTPIGLNFGAQVAGYVIEAREATGEWREFGFAPFASGVMSGPFREFGYTAAGGELEAEYRVVPAGVLRNFSWHFYALTTATVFHTVTSAALVDGKPAVVFIWLDGSMGTHVGFAIAANARPASAADWYLEHDLSLTTFDSPAPALASVQGLPAMAYCNTSAAPVSYSLHYRRRDSALAAPAGWSDHYVTSVSAYPGRLGLVSRQGRPAILHGLGGLNIMQSATAEPGGPGDWMAIAANPAINDFREIDAAASGPFFFTSGIAVQPSEYLVFNRSKIPAPASASDFSEYLLNPASANFAPSLELIGGIPCIAAADVSTSSLLFLRAGSRADDSAASWYLHQALTTPGADEYWNPQLQLVDGRPAVASGLYNLNFSWADQQYPDTAADWTTRQIATDSGASGNCILTTQGLPLIVYGSDQGTGNQQITIALATEL